MRHDGAMPDKLPSPALPLEPIFTIGHSTRSYAEFLTLLQSYGVQCVVDVRKLAGSRRYPHFNAEALTSALAGDGIAYVHVAALGGRRGRTLAPGAPSPNGFWSNDSFRRYADYALASSDFAAGLAQLLALASTQRCAVMCAEAVWWRCHRRIIADYLLLHGRVVQHIMSSGRTDAAQLTPGAQLWSINAPPAAPILPLEHPGEHRWVYTPQVADNGA